MMVGVDYWAGFTATFLTNRDLPFLKEAGIQIVRMDVGPSFESIFPQTVPILKANGIEVLALLMRLDLLGNIDAWGDYVYNRVLAYKDQIKVWEIWNEPNDVRYGFQNDPAGYTEFLKRAYVRAKQADPDCIVLGGSVWGTDDYGLNYIRSMYEYGAKDYMDALAFHPYCANQPPEYPYQTSTGKAFWKLQLVRDVMVENGDVDKKIWITEMGWSSNAVTEQQQADYLTRALTMAKNWSWVETFSIYNWMDGGDLYFGLTRTKYNPPYTHENFCKPSFFAVRDFISNNTKTV
jgi:hypothetical protein